MQSDRNSTTHELHIMQPPFLNTTYQRKEKERDNQLISSDAKENLPLLLLVLAFLLVSNNILFLLAFSPTLHALQANELSHNHLFTKTWRDLDLDDCVLAHLSEMGDDITIVVLTRGVGIGSGNGEALDDQRVLVAESAKVGWVGVWKADAVADGGGDAGDVASGVH
jgi:hypothetical protein